MCCSKVAGWLTMFLLLSVIGLVALAAGVAEWFRR